MPTMLGSPPLKFFLDPPMALIDFFTSAFIPARDNIKDYNCKGISYLFIVRQWQDNVALYV